jgi:hypothetical protein
MKEQDVRQRIEGFLTRTARELIIPASVGLSLGLSGCGSDVTPPYGAPPMLPEAGADLRTIVPHGGPAVWPDAGVDVYVPAVSIDAALPDAGVHAVAQDADVDAGMIDGEMD